MQMLKIVEFTEKDKERFWAKVDKSDDCWFWAAGKSSDGYGNFSITRRGHVKIMYRANRIAYKLCVGDIPDGAVVCHHCDNPSCVKPEHLFVGSQKDNIQDCMAKGRFVQNVPGKQDGIKNSQHVLNEEQVVEIKERLRKGETQVAIAKDYPVSRCAISNISTGRTWLHVT